jgi:hypothetical protein
MQGTTAVHHHIADTSLPQPEPVFHNPTALDTAVDVFDPSPPVVQGLVGELVLHRQSLAAWGLGRHKDVDLWQGEGEEAEIL